MADGAPFPGRPVPGVFRTRARARRIAGAALLVGCAVSIPPPAAAQGRDDPWVRSYYNLERSWIAHPPGAGLIFEAQIAPQLVVAQNLRGLFADGVVASTTEARWAYSASIAPMVRLRMVDEASQPVRTPSYMPHAVGQLMRVRNRSRESGERRLRRGPYEILTLQLRLSHHSNGQDGCLYTTQDKRTRAGGGFDCVFRPGQAPDPAAINRTDGSFSTNFLRGGAFYRRLALPPGVSDTVRATWYGGATAETHRSFLVNWIPGNIPDDQEALYGSWRWRLLGGGALHHPGGDWSGGSFLDVVWEGYPDASDLVPGWALSAEYARTFDRFGGWGLYVRWFTGQDYYNLGFGEKLNRVYLGLTWLQDRFERVGAPPLDPLG